MYSYEETILDQKAWTEYMLKYDSTYGRYHRHDKPEKFPFRVDTHLIDDDDGRRNSEDCLVHDFTYKQEVKCEHCNVTSMVWPGGGFKTS